ncbi:MAG TPA: hypothetical protein VFQ65_07865, partial [Kofleriaceae bacterium]|nr:hypothetical protein [Kofleriaceae bacterium]
RVMHAYARMTKQDGHHSGTEIEHGYQDWRDQRDRDARTGIPRPNTDEHGDHDSDRGYGRDDSNRERTSYRGQSGAQAGGHYDNEHMNYQGGNRGHWGDFDRGGQSGGGHDRNYDTQSPSYGRENERDRMSGWQRDQL